MKTLDEVIAYFDNQTQQRHVYLTEDADARFAEALHYLKDYRMLVNDFAEKRQELEDEKARYQEAEKNCETAENRHKAFELGYIRAMADYEELKRFWAESQDNPPLTWDELKQMEGKPVWYEHEFWKGWIILGKVEQGVNCEMIPDREERWYIVKDGSAKAYRKER